jgi:nonsense-mediated mRNA decay protein 3
MELSLKALNFIIYFDIVRLRRPSIGRAQEALSFYQGTLEFFVVTLCVEMASFNPYGQSQMRILCCQCGIAIEPNSANMCLSCIRTQVDISEGIPKQLAIQFCRNCERFLQPPTQWLPCALESKELMALCLRRLKGLNKVRLVDASFIWTEPHSKRLKIKITIQKEAFASTILQQSFVLEVIIGNQQCNDCARVMAKNTWRAVVQARQKVDHKRTFLYLEQLILKHNAHKDVTNIKGQPDGLDFFFQSRSHAFKFVDFLQAVVPCRYKTSEQLITQDVHSGDSTYKFTFSLEIVPLCKDDLVFLPPKIAKALGGISPLVLCTRVGTSTHFIDPNTLKTADISNQLYWREPFTALTMCRSLQEYYVMDVEETYDDAQGESGKYQLVEVQVVKASEFGRTTQTFFTRSHLGRILKAGDVVLGYDLATANFNNSDFDEARASRKLDNLPDVVLVRKSYAHLRRQGVQRKWKLRDLEKEEEGTAMDTEVVSKKKSPSAVSGSQRLEQERAARDMEMFMQDIEEDPEMRQSINVYRNPLSIHAPSLIQADGEMAEGEEDQTDRREIDIPLEELLDELTLETPEDFEA